MRIPNPTIIPIKNSRWIIYAVLLVSTAIFLSRTSFSLSEYNDFDLSNSSVPVDKIFHGGPARDGIPSIDNPKFIHPGDASFLSADDRILGIIYNGFSRAYPIKILNYHEIVNDKFKGKMIPSTTLFWFAWVAFHPDTEVYNTATKK